MSLVPHRFLPGAFEMAKGMKDGGKFGSFLGKLFGGNPLSGALGALQLGVGLTSKANRPKLTVTDATNQNVDIAKRRASLTKAPGAGVREERIETATADAISKAKRSTKSTSRLLSSISRTNAARLKALRNQDELDQRFQDDAQRVLFRANRDRAAEQRRVDDFNKTGRFMDESFAKSSLIGAGISNISDSYSDTKAKKMLEAILG